MKHPFLKKVHKLFNYEFNLMLVPNSGAKKIRNCRIPFLFGLVILIFVSCNIYIFLGYSLQVWQLSSFQRKISIQNETIAKLIAERSQLQPVLTKNQRFEAELNLYRQEYQKMFETWKRLHQKAKFRSVIASRGVFRPDSKNNLYQLTPITKANNTNTSLDQLKRNLDQLKNILQNETKEQEQLLQELQAYERHLDHTPSIWPTFGRIGSTFGSRFHPIFRRYIKHEGLDIAVEYGTTVRAAADGVVSFAGWESGYGYLVKINHDYGYETRYGHNSRLLVYAGQKVKKRQIICISGNSGNSTGPHLHYEVRVHGNPVNPVPFLKD